MKNSLALMMSINSENEDVWAINRADADEGEMVSCGNKISWMMWLGALTPPKISHSW